MEFLETRFQSLEIIKGTSKTFDSKHKQKEFVKRQDWSAKTHHTSSITCGFCKESHPIYSCKKFAELSTYDRYNFINKEKLCVNCLTHENKSQCKSTRTCSKCNKRHHTLLHHEKKEERKKTISANVSTKHEIIHKQTISNPTEVLLATAVVKVKTYEATWELLRVLIDPGSQTSFITEDAAESLGVPKTRACVQISGVGSTGAGTANYKIKVLMKPRFSSEFNLQCELLVLKKLTGALPAEATNELEMEELNNCLLADPTYNTPGPIDIIIGADVYPSIVKKGIKKPRQGYLIQNTEFGWVLSGQLNKSREQVQALSMISVAEPTDNLSKFWELEELQPTRRQSADDKKCEEFFTKTTLKQNNKYTVKLPLKESVNELGESRKKAMARLLQMEKKFQTDSHFQESYAQFMEEYEKLGHMVPINQTVNNSTSYYIPHHAVMKHDSSTTKLRVVFDASAKTSSGKSLNELMYTGPRLQENLDMILLRWRKHKFVLSADIEKMYRQIKVHEQDQHLQTILWRPTPHVPVKEYKLTTVTYGTSSAPYLAVRTLQQLARDEEKEFPVAANTTRNDFYVDDLLTGCNTVDEAKKFQEELISLLQKGSFNIRKWKSNLVELIENLPSDLQEKEFLEMGENGTQKTLGVHWAPIADHFKYDVKVATDNKPTKRKILSEIAKVYDPLGWLAPITITVKLLVQNLWVNENKWDDLVPEPIRTKWNHFQEQFPSVKDVKIPRWIHYDNSIDLIELHGFCDASERAYGAVIYSRVVDKHGQVFVTLLQAKSKVAPIKMKKTLARLELCAAVLLSKLFKQVNEALKIEHTHNYAWSDSMITLAWIQGNPDKWKNFVANRVVEIIENTNADIWRHVKSEENPADLISRGVLPEQLADKSIWWHGPLWLHQSTLPAAETPVPSTDEEQKKNCVMLTTQATELLNITEKYSCFHKLIRITAYCKRFLGKCRNQQFTAVVLTTDELRQAHNCIVRLVQEKHFSKEISTLSAKKSVDNKSTLITLLPFLDENGLIRVGGRLENSSLSYNEKHPIIIPHNDNFAKLIIQDAHARTLHGGNQLTLALVRQKYWIIRGKSLIRQSIRMCIKCFRAKANKTEQVMGNLPPQRVNVSPPFAHTGVDYAGPIQVRVSKGRGNKSYKGYIAIFVCMVTKAIHLEAVSDMTTDAFLAAFRRFQARRGHCSHLYSDNGTNFVGANGVLDKELKLALRQPTFQQSIVSEGTTWHFTPPAAPHFGGLWEAGVKSTKYHLKRVVGDSTLTFEKLTTVLSQIEACLNSRPLCVINNNPEDNTIITPGHLLIGRSLVTQPDRVDLDDNISVSTRWRLLQKMKRDFWKVWSTEYLHRLQQRYKWHTPRPNLKTGDVVLVRDENLTPTKWPLARITEVHPGLDNKTRVVTVKTQNGSEFKRPILKICPLPLNEEITPETKQEVRQTRSKTAGINIISCLLLLGVISSCHAASYSIKNPSPGLYVEHIGDAILNRGVLRLDIPINTTMLLLHEQMVNKTIKKFTTVCDLSDKLGAESHCHQQVLDLKQRHAELKRQMHVIRHGYGFRRKRGLLGQVLTSVFGVNDEVYTDISELDKNQKQLIQNSQHQTTIMLKTLTSLNSTEERITSKLNQFSVRLNHGLQQIEKFDHWYKAVDVNTVLIHVLAVYQLTEEVIRDLEDVYAKLLRVVHHQGHIVDFLTVGEFHRIISNVTAQLPAQFQILTQRMKKMEITVSEDEIALHVFLYITEKPKYTIIRITPVAQRVKNNIFTALQIDKPILAIDYNNQHYFEMSEMDLQLNVQVGTRGYLCAPNVVHDLNSAPNCIIDTIYSRATTHLCGQHTFTVIDVLWKHLYMPNTWMFVATSPKRVSLRCNGQLEDEWINNTGIIQIEQACTLETGRNLLKTRLTTNVQGVSSFHKPLMVNISVANVQEPKQKVQNPEPIYEAHEEFASILHDEKLLQENITATTWETIQPHVMGTGLVAVILAILMFIVFTIVWGVKRMRRLPTPSFVLAGQDVQS